MNTIIPWILGGLIILLVIGIVLTIRFWRESKVSPYYFLRRQAEQRMQTYSLGTVGTAVLLIFFVSYAAQPQDDTSLRMTLLSNSKPNSLNNTNTAVADDVQELSEEAVAEVDVPQVVELNGEDGSELSADLITQGSIIQAEDLVEGEAAALSVLEELDDSLAEGELDLPQEYDQLLPSVTLATETLISDLSFSNELDAEESRAVSPRRLFDESLGTIYATFDYASMADGMVWSWVWKHNGDVISGGNQEWVYGEDGPGYIYLSPDAGFLTGEYTLEIWVNGELMTESNMFVTDNLATSQ